MPEDIQNKDTTDQPTTPDTPTDGSKNTDDGQGGQSNTVPYDRFKSVNEERKELQARLEKLEAAQRQREEADKLAAGKHEEVIADLRPKADRAEALENTLKEYLQAELESVPEEFQALVPDGDVTTRLAWIKNAKAKNLFAARYVPDLDGGRQGAGGKAEEPLTAEELAVVARTGTTKESFLAAKKRRQGTTK